MRVRVLSEDEENKIVELYKNGMSQFQLYRKYGYPQNIVKRVLAKHGVNLRTKQEARVLRIPSYQCDCNIEPGKPINCTLQGERCIYREVQADVRGYLCDYCNKTGKLRGGSWESCDKYIMR